MSTTAKAETDKTALFGDSAEAATTATAAPETTVPVTETTVPVTAAADTDLPEVDNSDAGSEFNEEEEAPLTSEETSTAAEVLAPETPSTSVVKETPPPATPLSTSVINETPPPAAATEDENSNEEVVPLADSEMAMLNGEEETTDAPVTDADATAAPEGDGDFAKEEQEEEEEATPYADLPFFLNEETTFNYGDMCPVCFHAMTKEDMDDNMLANLLPCGHTLHVVCCDSLRKSMPTGNKTFNCPECSKAVAHAVTTTHTLGEQMEFKNQQGIIDSDEEEEEETDTEDEEAEMDKEEEEVLPEEPVKQEEEEEEDEYVSATPQPKAKAKAKPEPKKSRHTKKKKVEKPHQRRTKLFSKKHKKLAKNK